MEPFVVYSPDGGGTYKRMSRAAAERAYKEIERQLTEDSTPPVLAVTPSGEVTKQAIMDFMIAMHGGHEAMGASHAHSLFKVLVAGDGTLNHTAVNSAIRRTTRCTLEGCGQPGTKPCAAHNGGRRFDHHLSSQVLRDGLVIELASLRRLMPGIFANYGRNKPTLTRDYVALYEGLPPVSIR